MHKNASRYLTFGKFFLGFSGQPSGCDKTHCCFDHVDAPTLTSIVYHVGIWFSSATRLVQLQLSRMSRVQPPRAERAMAFWSGLRPSLRSGPRCWRMSCCKAHRRLSALSCLSCGTPTWRQSRLTFTSVSLPYSRFVLPTLSLPKSADGWTWDISTN